MIYIVWVAFCLFFAYANYRVIEYVDGRIRHGINGVFGSVTALYFAIEESISTGIILLLIARLFFDSFLSYLRFGRINYVSPKPKSLIDKLEQMVFGKDGYLPKLIYLTVVVLMVIL